MSFLQQTFKAPVKFNQNSTYVAVTEQDNLSIFNINPFGKIFELQGTTTGLYKTIDINGTSGILDHEEIGGVLTGRYLIEMLFATSLIAVVDTIQQPKKLKIINTKRKTAICELKFDHNVQQICLNRKRLVVLLQSKQIFIYDISCMQLLHAIDIMEDKVIKQLVWKQQQKKWLNRNLPVGGSVHTIDGNYVGEDEAYTYEVKIKLSGDDKSTLVYTTYSLNSNEIITGEDGDDDEYDSNNNVDDDQEDLVNAAQDRNLGMQKNTFSKGETKKDTHSNEHSKIVLNNIVVFDALNLKQTNFIPRVHNRNVQCLTLSYDGDILVTASTRGTIIRCFKTNSHLCFKELRRGNRPCTITQLELDHGTGYLACVGNTDTIHIFDVKDNLGPKTATRSSNSVGQASKTESKYSKVSKFLSSAIVSHIPRQSLQRNIAHIKKKNEKELVVIGFPSDIIGSVYVCYGDRLEVYNLPEDSGECALTQTHKFI